MLGGKYKDSIAVPHTTVHVVLMNIVLLLKQVFPSEGTPGMMLVMTEKATQKEWRVCICVHTCMCVCARAMVMVY